LPEIAPEVLRALRESRDWDEAQLAREFRAAAYGADVPVADHAGLRKMIPAWEQGRHRPSSRYRLLYRRVFASEWGVNGDAPDLAMIAAARARRDAAPQPVPSVAALLARADRSGRGDVQALAALVRELTGQVSALQERLAQLESGSDDDTGTSG